MGRIATYRDPDARDRKGVLTAGRLTSPSLYVFQRVFELIISKLYV